MTKSNAKKPSLSRENRAADPRQHSRREAAGAPRTREQQTVPRNHRPIQFVNSAVEDAVGVTVAELTALYILDGLKGLGPQKFKEIHTHGFTPAAIVANPSLLPTSGKRGDTLRDMLRDELRESEPVCRQRATTQILRAHHHGARIVTYRDPQYPPNVFESNYPAPILFVRGSLDVLIHRDAVACVGSRKIRPPYTSAETEFVQAACRRGFTVVAGFALGADTIGHEQALKAGGRTICVMPGGLDRPFPPENRPLWDELLRYPGAAFVSELGFGARASALTLRKRNKLIVAFARGVLVAQSATGGGAMNAYRFAMEQKKPITTFRADDEPDTSGNRLISESWTETLPRDHADLEIFNRWLRQLSSSM